MVVGDLTGRLSICAAKLTLEVLSTFEQINPLEQVDATSTHCKKVKKTDGVVDFDNADDVYAKFRAFFGWPGVFLENGLKLLEIDVANGYNNSVKGEILSIDETSIIVGCKEGALEIKALQPPSKKAMSAKAYCVGRGLKVGDTLI